MGTMWKMLKKDIDNSSSISYGSDGLHLIVKDKGIKWSLRGNTVGRYSDFILTKSMTSVRHFDFQTLWGKYLAVRLVGAHGSLYEMFRVW